MNANDARRTEIVRLIKQIAAKEGTAPARRSSPPKLASKSIRGAARFGAPGERPFPRPGLLQTSEQEPFHGTMYFGLYRLLP